jgi:formamidopyrimidine-DNA glycosylase
MPELPEVETVRQSIRPEVVGRLIDDIEILTPGVWLGTCSELHGFQVEDLQRRGKYLIFILKNGSQQATLIVHLRMTGRLLLQYLDQPIQKHTHFRMILTDQRHSENTTRLWLVFIDPRRFGRVWQLTGSDTAWPQGLAKLGPEPLDDQFNAEVLANRLAGRQANLKSLLLDQTIIAGLGNIYADESLFASSLHPARRANSLTASEVERLTSAIRDVLDRAIACNGTTLRDYADGWNRRGRFQDCLMVYGRAGEPCRVCGTTIGKIRLAGRSTCWCPSCQPEFSSQEAAL